MKQEAKGSEPQCRAVSLQPRGDPACRQLPSWRAGSQVSQPPALECACSIPGKHVVSRRQPALTRSKFCDWRASFWSPSYIHSHILRLWILLTALLGRTTVLQVGKEGLRERESCGCEVRSHIRAWTGGARVPSRAAGEPGNLPHGPSWRTAERGFPAVCGETQAPGTSPSESGPLTRGGSRQVAEGGPGRARGV